MTQAQELYQQKLTTPRLAAESIEDNSNLILGMGAAMPPALLNGIAERITDKGLSQLSLYYMHGTEALQCLLHESLQDVVKISPLFMSGFDRRHRHMQVGTERRRRMDFVPAMFHQVGRLLTEQITPDCFMVTVSPMDRHGYFSLGTNPDYGATVIRKAKKVIVEVNDNMPRVFGDCMLHVSQVDGIVENTTPLPEVIPNGASQVDQAIARQICEHIDNGSTLQLGIGGVPNAVMEYLGNHQGLGLHTELFSPGMVELIDKGVIDGSCKSLMPHKHVFTLALGDKKMFDFMDDNPAIHGYPASWVNNPSVIRKNHNMVSVNAAIEVDLSGQINAEHIAGQQFSGTGGQLDFVRGAYASPGGKSFIALNSTTKQGDKSKIVPLIQGGAVTDTRMDTMFVVTEYGCVNLKGLSISARARALIGLAHPKFREELEQTARDLSLL